MWLDLINLFFREFFLKKYSSSLSPSADSKKMGRGQDWDLIEIWVNFHYL